MKNYLNDDLSKEERTEIIGIIWMTVRNYKFKQYEKQRFEIPLIEDLDLQYYDLYDFEKFNFKLVFFFAFINMYTNTKISFLLSLDRKTIYNCKKSIKNKMEEGCNEK